MNTVQQHWSLIEVSACIGCQQALPRSYYSFPGLLVKLQADTFLANSDARPRAALRCSALCVRECVSERASLNSTLTLVLFFFLSHTLLSPSSWTLDNLMFTSLRARADPLSSRRWEPTAGGRRSPLSAVSMRCHKFWGPCSVGFYIWTAMLFRGRFWT